MNKYLGVIAAIAAALAVAPHAHAAGEFYAGVDLMRMKDKGDHAPAFYPLGLGIRGGMQVHPNVAVEARYTAGVKSDNNTVSGMNVELELNQIYGVYAKGMLPLGRVSPYLLVGYTHGKETAKISAIGMSSAGSDGDFSYGIGIDVPITKDITFGAEWARFIKGTDPFGVGFKIEGMTFNVSMRF
ncbi:MAG TPA: porin family protein [Paucimonas sp.]|nr:porin family protein [Paucimonas sp.]